MSENTDNAADLAFERVVLTGTPGTGKTTVAERVGDRLDIDVHHLNDLIREEGLHEGEDEQRGSLVADLDAIRKHLGDWSGLLDSHLAHHFGADAAIVLRCHPDELEARLEERDEPEAKIAENAESEALDIVLSEAVRAYGEENVYEIDTTDRSVEAVVDDVLAVLRGEREPSAGTVDFTGAL
ncbi:adenylate kinase family protein [Halolamina salifodinae]|uniref:Putative adenylate kinase n=1 Tax=Halolamina salifodinae TaxID=1202767 RepID=A0A8T4GUY6_9EURY|nr:adenylate kinase family protein [Halolamina salifodinae]MBP1986699.1 adenylate kinase [Halolamina salifodinae]